MNAGPFKSQNRVAPERASRSLRCAQLSSAVSWSATALSGENPGAVPWASGSNAGASGGDDMATTGSRACSGRPTPRIGGTLGGGSGPVRWGVVSGFVSGSLVSILAFIQRTPDDTSKYVGGEVLQPKGQKSSESAIAVGSIRIDKAFSRAG